MNLNLETRLQQTLSPQMIQSLKLLQVSTLQLEQLVKQELEENPVLEEVAEEADKEDTQEQNAEETSETPAVEQTSEERSEPTGEDDNAAEERMIGENKNKDEINWESYFEEGFDIGYRRTEEERVDEIYHNTPVAEQTLEEHLFKQLTERNLKPDYVEICRYLIGNVDENGYLMAEIDDIIREITEKGFIIDNQDVRECIHILQGFEPPGIGARSLQETLLIQLRRQDFHDTLEMRIIEKHFDLFQKLKIADIAKALDANLTNVQLAIKNIGLLDPKPGSIISHPQAQIVIPDLIVENVNGEFIVSLNDKTVPRLRINSCYRRLLEQKQENLKDAKRYIKEKLTSASWFIRSIEQRKSTMIRVMESIIRHQPEFFNKGPSNLCPLILQTIADNICMHISTISRVTRGKYVQTPHGVYELKHFFGVGVEQKDGSEVSSEKTKKLIRDLVTGEDHRKPLSDQRIMEELGKKNIIVARRTVSKYREKLRILPARLRKKY